MGMLRWVQATRLRRVIAAAGVVAIVPALALAWWLGSPLFLDKTVDEAFPLTSTAQVPDDMTRAEAELVLEEAAKSDTQVDEDMPVTETPDAAGNGGTLTRTPTVEASATTPGPTATATAITPTPTSTLTLPPEEPAPVALSMGSFRDADNFHHGSGQATIYQLPDGSYLLRLEDFNVTNGPELHVLLSPHPDPTSRSQVMGPGYIDLGDLKGNIGNQNYPVPIDADVTAYQSVVIYCKPFNVLFSVAPLTLAKVQG